MKKIIFHLALCLPVFALVLSSATICKAQAISSEEIKALMVKEWVRAKAYTDSYLDAMPAGKYSFKAVDSIRSFAQQMLHLAQGNIFLMSKAVGQPPLAFIQSDMEHSPGAQMKDSVVYYVNTSYDYCINAVKNSDVNKWGEMVKFFDFTEPRLALMMKAFEHQTHHRGQTTIYIRLLGIRPPEERLFSKPM